MNETWMPGSKTELMSAIEHEWNALIALADSLTDEQMKTPDSGGWSPKDNLAHITEWKVHGKAIYSDDIFKLGSRRSTLSESASRKKSG